MSGTIGSNPIVAQGTLNRLRASVIFPSFPNLTVTTSYLSKRAITMSFQGEATVLIDTMTGYVTSPEPYLRCTVSIHMIKSQSFSQQFKTQLELNTLLGDCTVRPDSAMQQPYNLSNCAIMAPGPQDFSGADVDYLVTVAGLYYINSQLFLT